MLLLHLFFCKQTGTGCFILYNTGEDLVYSQNGLLTTVAYKWNDDDAVYALEVRSLGIAHMHIIFSKSGFYCYCWRMY